MALRIPKNPLISEIFQSVSSAKTKKDKVEILQQYKNDAVIALLIWNFDDTAQSALPEGPVPYTPNEAPVGTEHHTRLVNEARKLHHFVKGGSNISQNQRENLFISMLESLSKEEAELICLVKDGKLTSRYKITHNVVKESYPEIVWGNRGS